MRERAYGGREGLAATVCWPPGAACGRAWPHLGRVWPCLGCKQPHLGRQQPRVAVSWCVATSWRVATSWAAHV